VTGVVDFFDFFVVGFLVSVLAPKWHLTFGQTSIMLMSAGIGAMLGALASGFLADRFGPQAARRRRCPDLRPQFRSDCADTGGRLDLLCDTALLRRLWLAAGAAAAVPAIVEFAPTRHRTLVTSLVVVPVAFGVLSASITASYLLPLVVGAARRGRLPADHPRDPDRFCHAGVAALADQQGPGTGSADQHPQALPGRRSPFALAVRAGLPARARGETSRSRSAA